MNWDYAKSFCNLNKKPGIDDASLIGPDNFIFELKDSAVTFVFLLIKKLRMSFRLCSTLSAIVLNTFILISFIFVI